MSLQMWFVHFPSVSPKNTKQHLNNVPFYQPHPSPSGPALPPAPRRWKYDSHWLPNFARRCPRSCGHRHASAVHGATGEWLQTKMLRTNRVQKPRLTTRIMKKKTFQISDQLPGITLEMDGRNLPVSVGWKTKRFFCLPVKGFFAFISMVLEWWLFGLGSLKESDFAKAQKSSNKQRQSNSHLSVIWPVPFSSAQLRNGIVLPRVVLVHCLQPPDVIMGMTHNVHLGMLPSENNLTLRRKGKVLWWSY